MNKKLLFIGILALVFSFIGCDQGIGTTPESVALSTLDFNTDDSGYAAFSTIEALDDSAVLPTALAAATSSRYVISLPEFLDHKISKKYRGDYYVVSNVEFQNTEIFAFHITNDVFSRYDYHSDGSFGVSGGNGYWSDGNKLIYTRIINTIIDENEPYKYIYNDFYDPLNYEPELIQVPNIVAFEVEDLYEATIDQLDETYWVITFDSREYKVIKN